MKERRKRRRFVVESRMEARLHVDGSVTRGDVVDVNNGYAYPVLAFLGLLIHPTAGEGAAFSVHRRLRGGIYRVDASSRMGGRLFQDLKEILFVGPLVALTAGTALEALAARGGLAKAAAIAILFGLIGFGIAKHVSYLMPWVRLAELG